MWKRNIRRGQPGNAGQFAAGTAGMAAPTPSPTAVVNAAPPETGSAAAVDYATQHARLMDGLKEGIYYAEHPDSTPDRLHGLAQDPDAAIRMRVAYHPNASGETHELLSLDEDPNVRHFVAANTRQVDVLHRLAVDEDPAVRETARRNPACPKCEACGGYSRHGALCTPCDMSARADDLD